MRILRIIAVSGAVIAAALAGCSSSGNHKSGYGGYSSQTNSQTVPGTSGNCQTGTGYNCPATPSTGGFSSGGGGGGSGY